MSQHAIFREAKVSSRTVQKVLAEYNFEHYFCNIRSDNEKAKIMLKNEMSATCKQQVLVCFWMFLNVHERGSIRQYVVLGE